MKNRKDKLDTVDIVVLVDEETTSQRSRTWEPGIKPGSQVRLYGVSPCSMWSSLEIGELVT